jgi:PIH1 N-terminal domain
MFDFHSSQIKESFADNQEKNDPLEEPKIYLNVVFHEKVLTPLNKNRDLADPKNDRDWMIIPMIFTEGKKRKNIEGIECITYDVHINNCAV